MTLEKIGALHPPSFPSPPPGFQEGRGPTKPPPPKKKRKFIIKPRFVWRRPALCPPPTPALGRGRPPPPSPSPSRACLEVPGWALMWSYGGGFLFGGGGGGGGKGGKGGGAVWGFAVQGFNINFYRGWGLCGGKSSWSPGIPAATRPAPTPGSHRPPSR